MTRLALSVVPDHVKLQFRFGTNGVCSRPFGSLPLQATPMPLSPPQRGLTARSSIRGINDVESRAVRKAPEAHTEEGLWPRHIDLTSTSQYCRNRPFRPSHLVHLLSCLLRLLRYPGRQEVLHQPGYSTTFICYLFLGQALDAAFSQALHDIASTSHDISCAS